jgi:hypothetical protein
VSKSYYTKRGSEAEAIKTDDIHPPRTEQPVDDRCLFCFAMFDSLFPRYDATFRSPASSPVFAGLRLIIVGYDVGIQHSIEGSDVFI